MKNSITALLLFALAIAGFGGMATAQSDGSQPGSRMVLREGWQIQSSAKAADSGSVISTSHYRPSGWYSCTVPSTVLAALVAHRVYPNPDFGMNLRSIPGTSYPIGANFANLPMPAGSPFRVAWWNRTQFRLPAGWRGKQLWLHFRGINNSANIWLNGHRIASADQVTGMYRTYRFNVTEAAVTGAGNALAVEVFPPTPRDLSITFVDWNPLPPDKDMGVFRSVFLTASGPVALRDPQVVTRFDLPSLAIAHVTVAANLENATGRVLTGVLKATLGGVSVSQNVSLGPHETRRVAFTPQEYAALNLAHPRLWWPWQYGPQNFYRLHLEFDMGGAVSDRASVPFALREITSRLDAANHRVFSVNGKRILIRGAGWSPDMMLRPSPQRVEDEIRYVRNLNLNTIRLEGKLMDEHFYNFCDRHGILVVAGWCCCSHWERWRTWGPKDYAIAGESLRSQARLLRNHPCILAFLYGSDNSPNAQAESVYLKVFHEEHWPDPTVAGASSRHTPGGGWTGMKMTGPYQYVAPSYWYEDHSHGGAFGFNTETSPGPAIPVLASLKQFLPPDHLWPVDDVWNDHAGGGVFKNIGYYTMALSKRYGKPKGLDDFVEKAQVTDYEGERAMFEAYGRNKYTSTGVIQWMLNNAWPSIVWHLFDYYLRPGGGYFGTKKACETLHIQYSYDDQSIAVVNSTLNSFQGYTAQAAVYDLHLKREYDKAVKLDVAPDSSAVAFTIPKIADISKTYFLRLELRDETGKTASRNFYWLSTHPDVSNWGQSAWYYTPLSGFADLTGLEKLPEAELRASSRPEPGGGERIEVANPTRHLAFFVHLTILQGQRGRDVEPVLWQDNDFELMPGERRNITAVFSASGLAGARPVVEVSGWNVKPFIVP